MAALGTIVMVGALLFAMVLVMAAISTVPLRLASQRLDAVQAQFLARSAIAQIRYEFLTAEEQSVQGANGIDFSHPPRPPLNLASRFASPVFTVPGNSDYGQVTITYDPTQPYYSTDNLMSELPAAGYLDRGTPNTSVPPFSTQVLVTVKTPSSTYHYAAILSQVWNYAVFSASGMTLDENTTVTGNVGITAIDPSLTNQSQTNVQTIQIGDGTAPTTPTTTTVDGNADILFSRAQANAALGAGQPLPSLVRLLYGGQLAGQEVHDLVPQGTVLGTATTGGLAIVFPDPAGFTAASINAVSSEAMRSWNDFTADGGYVPDLSTATTVPQMLLSSARHPVEYLTESASFDGASGPANLMVASSLTNYKPTFTVVKDPNTGKVISVTMNSPDAWDYSGAGLSLKDCVLYVNGNLDLVKGPAPRGGPSPSPSPTALAGTSIYGDNATLIVNGALRLEQGSLSASDRGLVIMADAISLESGGTYNGLIVARQELRIVPMSSSEHLSVVGSIFAKGSNVEETKQWNDDTSSMQTVTTVTLLDHPLQISSTDVRYDPRYVKALNQLGILTLKSWRSIP